MSPLTLITAGFLFYRAETGRIRQEKFQELQTIAGLKAAQIQQWRKERVADVNRGLRSAFFREAVETFCHNPENDSLRESLRERLKAELDYGMHSDALLVAMDGRVLLSASPQPEPVDAAEIRAAEESTRSGKASLSNLYVSRSGRIYLDALGPVLGKNDKPIAILVLRSNPEMHLYPLVQSWPTSSRTAETLLVCRDGNDVLFLNDLRQKANTALTLRYPLTRSDVPAVQAVLGEQGAYQGKDYRGMEVLADLRHIPESPWFMVAKVDTAEIFAEARYRAGVISLSVILLILLAATVTAYAYRHRQAGLYKILYRLEQAERESHELFRTTLYSIGDAVITTDSSGRVTQMNLVAEQLTGWQEVEAKGKSLREVFHIVNEETRDEVENPVDRVLREGKVIGLANHTVLIERSGTEYPITDSGAPIRSDSGAIVGVVLVFRDQIKERLAEKALRASEKKYRSFFTTSRDCVFITSPFEQWVDFNDAALELFGYESREEFSKIPIPQLYEHPEERAQFHRLILEKGYMQEHPVRLKRRDGAIIDTLITAASIRNEDGSTTALVGTIRDVTARKKSEELLRESERMSRATIDALSATLCVLDENGTILDVNTAWRRFADENPPVPFGYAVGVNYLEVCDNATGPKSEEAAPFAEGVRSVMRDEVDGFSLEYPCHSSENARWFVGRVTRFPSNGVLRLVITHEDITTRKLAEEKLRENKDRLDLALQSARMGAWHWDIVENKRYFDYQVCYLLGINPATFTGSAEEFFDAVHPDDRDTVRTALARTMEQDEPYEPDYRSVWPDESIHYITARGRLVRDSAGKPLKIYGIIWDISSRKLAEEALQASLKEKETLLKEIHHRVKNNLQVMSSLLNMQCQHLDDPTALDALKVSMHRIKTMALIHDKLYRSENLSSIYFPGYASDLAHDLISTYALSKDIVLNLDIDPVSLDIDTAIPLGLIINELVSNALKHAFKGEEAGMITIGLYTENTHATLVVSDTGAGFPDEVDFMKTESMGMQLVVTLVEQLEGTIELKRNKGTEFTISFGMKDD